MPHLMRRAIIALSAAGAAAVLGASLAAPAASAATATAAVHPAAVTQVRYQQAQKWDLSGRNEISLPFAGQTWTYQVRFSQSAFMLRGHRPGQVYALRGYLTDAKYYLLTTGQDKLLVMRIKDGSVTENRDGTATVKFTVSYPAGSVQGNRTFTGTVKVLPQPRHHRGEIKGQLAGTWSQDGSQAVPAGSTWAALYPVKAER